MADITLHEHEQRAILENPEGDTNPPQPVDHTWFSQAALDVTAERRRQISAEGWTPEHDDAHGAGSMAFAAAAYAVHAHAGPRLSSVLWNWTGWARAWWKPKDARRDLVRAAALLLAEIERIDRAAETAARGGAGGQQPKENDDAG